MRYFLKKFKIIFFFSIAHLFLFINQVAAENVKLDNPLTGDQNPLGIPVVIGRIVRALLGVIGVVALLFFVIGGFYYLGSAGNPEKVKKGTQTLVWAIVGMIVAFGSYALLDFILKAVT